MKSFWQTSEFWIALVSNLTGMAVLLGAITSTQADQIKNAVQQIVGGIIALIPIITYIISRTSLKKVVVDNMPPIQEPDVVKMSLESGKTLGSSKTVHEIYGEALKQAGI